MLFDADPCPVEDDSAAKLMLPDRRLVEYFVEAAGAAPSGDNIQPWRFCWDGKSLLVLGDRVRGSVFYDVEYESMLVALGASMENISLAAGKQGFAIKWQMMESLGDEQVAAKGDFSKCAGCGDELFHQVRRRHTNRYAYCRTVLSAQQKALISEEAKKVKGAEIVWVDNPAALNACVFANYSADKILFENALLHRDLFSWIEGARGREIDSEGMSYQVLGLSALERLFFPYFRSWTLVRRLNCLGLSSILASRNRFLYRESGAFCAVVMPKGAIGSFLRGGMAMQRAWLKAASLGLAVQPLSGFIFLLNHLEKTELEDFSPTHRQLLHEVYTRLKKVELLEDSKQLVMFFRMGYPKREAFRTGRRVVSDVLFSP